MPYTMDDGNLNIQLNNLSKGRRGGNLRRNFRGLQTDGTLSTGARMAKAQVNKLKAAE